MILCPISVLVHTKSRLFGGELSWWQREWLQRIGVVGGGVTGRRDIVGLANIVGELSASEFSQEAHGGDGGGLCLEKG